MRFAGIDIGSRKHVVALVDERESVLQVATEFEESAEGYAQLQELLGPPEGLLVAMEATGHYWQNLFAWLAAQKYSVALLNPLRTRRFAEEELVRTKTDAIDARGIARFAAQKRPPATPLPDAATLELRELVRLRDRWVQDLKDRENQLHRLVDLCFPEFKRHVKDLGTELATALLHAYPTAQELRHIAPRRAARLTYGAQRTATVKPDLARALVEDAKVSVAQHHGRVYQMQIRFACEDIQRLLRRLQDLDKDLQATLDRHEVGTLLTTIPGIGGISSARILTEAGDPASFRDGAALAAYVGAVPALRQSGKRRTQTASLTPLGNARLRKGLWMPTLVAVRCNPWLRAYYLRLRSRGKRAKVALMACMRKLLLAVYSVAKNRRPFVPQLTHVVP